MNILGYVEKFGHEEFSTRPFNNVDAVIFSVLSYINFDELGKRKDSNPIYLKDLEPEMFPLLCKGEFITNKNIKLLTLLKASPRYRNVGVSFIRGSHCIHKEEQFFAITLIMPTGDFFVSYRGTDLTMVGWKEDANMAFQEVIPSQHSALEYLKLVASKLPGNFYVGGHSKGGNLAFYTHINMGKDLLKRALHSYSLDGPGFFDTKDKISDTFEETHLKMTKLVPQNSMVGIIMSTLKNCDIVQSNYVGIFQHDPYSWQIDPEKKDFKYRTRRTKESYINEITLSLWLADLSKEDKIFAVDALFELLGGTHLTLGAFIKQPIERIKTAYIVQKEAAKEDRDRFVNIFKNLFKSHRKARLVYRKRKEVKYKAIKEIKEI